MSTYEERAWNAENEVERLRAECEKLNSDLLAERLSNVGKVDYCDYEAMRIERDHAKAELASRNQALARADNEIERVKTERDKAEHETGRAYIERDALRALLILCDDTFRLIDEGKPVPMKFLREKLAALREKK